MFTKRDAIMFINGGGKGHRGSRNDFRGDRSNKVITRPGNWQLSQEPNHSQSECQTLSVNPLEVDPRVDFSQFPETPAFSSAYPRDPPDFADLADRGSLDVDAH